MKELNHYWYSYKARITRAELGDPINHVLIDGKEVTYTVYSEENICSSKFGDEVYLELGEYSR